MHKAFLVPALASLLLAGCGKSPAPDPSARFEAQPRPLLGGTEASSPRIAVSDNDTLALLTVTGAAPRRQLVLSLSRDGGDTLSSQLAVSAPGAVVMARGEMAPVLRVKGGNAFALWEQTPEHGPTQVLVSESSDGRAFTPAAEVVHNARPDFRGFANLSQPVGKTLYAVWLDGRDPRRPQGTFDVYLARSDDQGAHWGDGVRVGSSGCPCCRPAVAADGHGNVYVAWRKVYPGDQRDLALSVSHDNGATFGEPLRVADEHWTLHACPESGPSLALANNGQLSVAWFSGAGHPAVRVATSRNGAQPFHVAEVPATIADQNHPQLAQSSDGALWLTLQGRAVSTGNAWPPLIAFALPVRADGSLGPITAVPTGGILGYPQIAAADGGRLFVVSARDSMGQSQVEMVRGRAAGHPR